MLGYKWTMLVVSALSISPGVFFVFMPEATSMELMSAQSVDLETFGEGHKEGQIFLVRLLGCWVLGYGVLCFFLSRIRDSEVQSLVLKGLIISALFVALGSIASPEGWVSLVLSGAVLVVLITGMLRHQLSEEAG